MLPAPVPPGAVEPGHLLEEELGVKALAHQPSLHVGEGDNNRVNRAGLDRGPQLFETQHGGDPIPSGQPRILRRITAHLLMIGGMS